MGVLYKVQITRETQEKCEYSSSVELLISYYEMRYYRIAGKTLCERNSYKGISFLSTTYTICSSVLKGVLIK